MQVPACFRVRQVCEVTKWCWQKKDPSHLHGFASFIVHIMPCLWSYVFIEFAVWEILCKNPPKLDQGGALQQFSLVKTVSYIGIALPAICLALQIYFVITFRLILKLVSE